MPTTKTRKSIALDARDTERLSRFDVDPTLYEAARRLFRGTDDLVSETALLHALLVIGLDAAEREADEERYALLAASTDEEDAQYAAALRGRRR